MPTSGPNDSPNDSSMPISGPSELELRVQSRLRIAEGSVSVIHKVEIILKRV
jgi:hypothetical protein